MKIQHTGALGARSVKLLVYGQAGAGKTSLIKTLPSPIVLSAEAGLLSIADANVPFIEVNSMDTLREAYMWLRDSDEGSPDTYKTVCLDSISEVAEVVLAHELKHNKDGRAAYGALNTTMTEMIRAFRDLPNRHVYFSAKLEKSADEMGKLLFNPSMPGKSLTQSLPYFFDEVLALRVEKDGEGVTQRALMCESDGIWLAKDRSGRLGPWATPDLGEVINTIAAPAAPQEGEAS